MATKKKQCKKCKRICENCTCKKSWREHGNSTRDEKKRNELIELTRGDISQQDACAYVGLPVRTFHDWLKRDDKLSQEYERAKKYMDVITSNAISSAIIDKNTSAVDKAKLSFDWKKRRDKRYSDKVQQETTVTVENPLGDMLKEMGLE